MQYTGHMIQDLIGTYCDAVEAIEYRDVLATATLPLSTKTHNLSQLIVAAVYQSAKPVPPSLLYDALQHFELIPAGKPARARAASAVSRLLARKILYKDRSGLTVLQDALKQAGLPLDFIPPDSNPNPLPSIPNLPPYPLSPAPLPPPLPSAERHEGESW